MKIMRIKLLLVVISLFALNVSAQETGQDLFWKNLSQYCGKSFEGKITSEGKNEGFDGERLVMHVKTCSDGQLKIPFFVGDDKSRTWVLTKENDGILLKHDHRDKNGTPEEITMYGGKASNFGTENMQAFPADQETCDLIGRACFNVWWITVDDKAFTYNLRVVNSDRLFTVSFDLTKEVQTPEDPWGWKD